LATKAGFGFLANIDPQRQPPTAECLIAFQVVPIAPAVANAASLAQEAYLNLCTGFVWWVSSRLVKPWEIMVTQPPKCIHFEPKVKLAKTRFYVTDEPVSFRLSFNIFFAACTILVMRKLALTVILRGQAGFTEFNW